MPVIGSPLLMLTARERRAGKWHSSEETSILIIRALTISALMFSVGPSVPPVSAHQYPIPVHINATYQCLPVHINATYQCLPVHINATYQ
ncbi:unnamed protein product, partial [Staurois parvus]